MTLREPLDHALHGGELISGQRKYLDRQRRLRVASSTFLVRSSGGGAEGAGVVFRDLQTEDALQRFEQETERLRFIRAVSAGMAHENSQPAGGDPHFCRAGAAAAG